jgi:hypothetical protein
MMRRATRRWWSSNGGLLRFDHDFGAVTLSSLTGYDSVEQLLADESGGLPYIQFQGAAAG